VKSARGRNRRDRILTEAARLFRRSGFHTTGIDDIGAAVGITGPGVYRHFESKQHLLAAILDVTMDRHQQITTDVSEAGLEPKEALERLVRLSAAELAGNRDAAAIYFQEARNLPPAELQKFTRIQRQLIAEWVRTLRAARPELSEEEARVAVRAVGGLLNSVGYFTTNMSDDRLGAFLSDIAIAALLGSPSTR
jgi:AcrR family transcriptional regulator